MKNEGEKGVAKFGKHLSRRERGGWVINKYLSEQ